MLRRIRIQNHALIEQVELHLGEGFHVFTGETGSGKSILLGAVGLLLGDRGDSSGVGLHGDRAIIEGDFSALQLQGWLENEELPVGACVTVRREDSKRTLEEYSSATPKRRWANLKIWVSAWLTCIGRIIRAISYNGLCFAIFSTAREIMMTFMQRTDKPTRPGFGPKQNWID